MTRGLGTLVTLIYRLYRRTLSNNISSTTTAGLYSIAPHHLNKNKQPTTKQPIPEQPIPEQPAPEQPTLEQLRHPEQPTPEQPMPEQPKQPAAERASALLKDVIEALPSI